MRRDSGAWSKVKAAPTGKAWPAPPTSATDTPLRFRPPVAGLLLWAIKYVELVLGWAGWPAMRDDARRLEDMRLFAG